MARLTGVQARPGRIKGDLPRSRDSCWDFELSSPIVREEPGEVAPEVHAKDWNSADDAGNFDVSGIVGVMSTILIPSTTPHHLTGKERRKNEHEYRRG